MSIKFQAEYIRCYFINAFLIAVFIENAASERKLLFRNGWYKNDDKGPKHPLINVTYIDNQVVRDSEYIRIKSRMTTLHESSIRNLFEVKTFKMISCEIINVEPGAFLKLPNLETLALNDNKIEQISSGVFNHFNLTKLFLHKNNIKSIDTEAFDDMPNLFLLKLNSNKLTNLDSNWFRNTPKMTDLFLRRNEITHIPSEAFKNMRGSHDIYGIETMYAKVFLSKNLITSIHRLAFHGIKGLNQLWLDRNEIQEFDEMIFAELEYIGIMFLSKNKLRRLPKNFLLGLRSDLMTLDLAGNKNLSCLDYEIASRVKILNMEKIHKLNCQCIDSLVDRLFKEGKDTEIRTDCKKDKIH